MADDTTLSNVQNNLTSWLNNQQDIRAANIPQIIAQQRGVPNSSPMWNMFQGGGQDAASLLGSVPQTYGQSTPALAAMAAMLQPDYIEGTPAGHMTNNTFTNLAIANSALQKQYEQQARGAMALQGTGQEGLEQANKTLNSPIAKDASNAYQQQVAPFAQSQTLTLPNQVLSQAQENIAQTNKGMDPKTIAVLQNDPQIVNAASQRVVNGQQVLADARNSGQSQQAIQAALNGNNPNAQTAQEFNATAGALKQNAYQQMAQLTAKGGATQAINDLTDNNNMLKNLGQNIPGLKNSITPDSEGFPQIIAGPKKVILQKLLGNPEAAKAFMTSGIDPNLVTSAINNAAPGTSVPIGDAGATVTTDATGNVSLNVGKAFQQSLANQQNFSTNYATNKALALYGDQINQQFKTEAGADKTPTAVVLNPYGNYYQKLQSAIHENIKDEPADNIYTPVKNANGKVISITKNSVPYDSAPPAAQIQIIDKMLANPDFVKKITQGSMQNAQ